MYILYDVTDKVTDVQVCRLWAIQEPLQAGVCWHQESVEPSLIQHARESNMFPTLRQNQSESELIMSFVIIIVKCIHPVTINSDRGELISKGFHEISPWVVKPCLANCSGQIIKKSTYHVNLCRRADTARLLNLLNGTVFSQLIDTFQFSFTFSRFVWWPLWGWWCSVFLTNQMRRPASSLPSRYTASFASSSMAQLLSATISAARVTVSVPPWVLSVSRTSRIKIKHVK